MANCSEATSQQMTEVNGLNSKLGYDAVAQLQLQAQLDNQNFSRLLNHIAVRRAENAATVDHLSNVGLLQAGQTGMTENQQQVNPIRTGTADAMVGGVGVAAEQVAANIPALGDIVVKLAEAVAGLQAIVGIQVQPKS